MNDCDACRITEAAQQSVDVGWVGNAGEVERLRSLDECVYKNIVSVGRSRVAAEQSRGGRPPACASHGEFGPIESRLSVRRGTEHI